MGSLDFTSKLHVQNHIAIMSIAVGLKSLPMLSSDRGNVRWAIFASSVNSVISGLSSLVIKIKQFGRVKLVDEKCHHNHCPTFSTYLDTRWQCFNQISLATYQNVFRSFVKVLFLFYKVINITFFVFSPTFLTKMRHFCSKSLWNTIQFYCIFPIN